MSEKHIVPQQILISKQDRNQLNQHKSAIIWFTGLPSSGKSTLATKLEESLHAQKARTYVLDGDNIRGGLNKDLSFAPEDRKENIRRIGEVAKLFIDAGIITLTAFVSPYREDRDMVRNLVDAQEFIEVFVKCPVEVCQNRDVKGLYKKAKDGIIKGFTGIDAPYEEPENPEITIETDKISLEQSIQKILQYLQNREFFQ